MTSPVGRECDSPMAVACAAVPAGGTHGISPLPAPTPPLRADDRRPLLTACADVEETSGVSSLSDWSRKDPLSSALAHLPVLSGGQQEVGNGGVPVVPRDPVLLDLLGDNIREALASGLVGEWKLGQAVARVLTERR